MTNPLVEFLSVSKFFSKKDKDIVKMDYDFGGSSAGRKLDISKQLEDEREGMMVADDPLLGTHNKEQVHHPSHYNMGKFEVIDVIEDWKLGFNSGSAVKYIARADYKGHKILDLTKALWYIVREIKRVGGVVDKDKLP